MAVSIVFNAINVAGQKTNSTISIGEVLQNTWSAHAKLNIGQGIQFGINNTILFVSTIVDPEVVDAPIVDNDIVGPTGQNQTL